MERTPKESAQKVNSGEQNSPAGIRTRNLSITSRTLFRLPTDGREGDGSGRKGLDFKFFFSKDNFTIEKVQPPIVITAFVQGVGSGLEFRDEKDQSLTLIINAWWVVQTV